MIHTNHIVTRPHAWIWRSRLPAHRGRVEGQRPSPKGRGDTGMASCIANDTNTQIPGRCADSRAGQWEWCFVSYPLGVRRESTSLGCLVPPEKQFTSSPRAGKNKDLTLGLKRFEDTREGVIL